MDRQLRKEILAAILIVLCLIAALSFAREAELAMLKQALTGRMF